MMQRTRRFFSQALISGKSILGPFDFSEFVLGQVGYTFLTLLFYCLLASYYTGSLNLSHWVIGNSLVLCVNTCIFNLGGVFGGDRYFGRLKFIFASPSSLLLTVIEKGIVSVLIAFCTVMVSFFCGGLLFRIDFSGINYFTLVVIILIASFTSAGLGLMLSAISLLSDSINLLLNVITSVVMLLSGANFPITQLPNFVQHMALFFPLNRAVSAAKICLGEGDYDAKKCLYLIAGEFLLGICFYIAAVILLKYMERLAIKYASLELF